MKNLKLEIDWEGEWVTLFLNERKIAEGHSLSGRQLLEVFKKEGIIDSYIEEEI